MANNASIRLGALFVSFTIFLVIGSGCSTAPATDTERKLLVDDSVSVLRQMKSEDATLVKFLSTSRGYVVYPEASKGGLLVGGAYGRGVVFDAKGNFVGYADLSQATVGLQAGGQSFNELIVFESDKDFDRFVGGKLTLAVNASAVVLKAGAAKSARYTDGVAVFTSPTGGLMLEAAVGGQQFTYLPK